MFIHVLAMHCDDAHYCAVLVYFATTMDVKRQLVLNLHKKGLRQVDIFRKLQTDNINLRFIQRTIKRYKEHGTVDVKRKPGKKRSVRTKDLVKKVRKKILRNNKRSARILAREHNISRSSMRRVLKEDLGMKPLKKTRTHGLTIKNKQDRKQKCKELLRRAATSNIVFSDEKLFLLQPSLNAQNDRVYAASIEDIPEDDLAVERFQNVSSVMVWAAVSADHKFPLVFVEKGVKINAAVYEEEILRKNLLPHAEAVFGDEPWVFQQDGAPAHRANKVQQWLRENVPDFLNKDEWPPSSPDLNPLDYFVWGYMQSKLSDLKIKKITKLDSFKKKIVKIWNDVPIEMVRSACKSFLRRLRLVVRANGGRIKTKT